MAEIIKPTKINIPPLPCNLQWQSVPWSSPEGFTYLDMYGKLLTQLNANIENTNILIDNDTAIEATLKEHDKRITKNYEDNVTQAGWITTLINRINDVTARVTELETSMNDVDTQLNTIVPKVNEMYGNQKYIESAEYINQIEENTANIETNTLDIRGITGAMNNYTDNFSEAIYFANISIPNQGSILPNKVNEFGVSIHRDNLPAGEYVFCGGSITPTIKNNPPLNGVIGVVYSAKIDQSIGNIEIEYGLTSATGLGIAYTSGDLSFNLYFIKNILKNPS